MKKNLKILCLQHVALEGPDLIETWAYKKNHTIQKIIFEKGDSLPKEMDFDWLLIMGGAMGVHDEDKYDWMPAEKKFIKAAIDAGRVVIGICLGAQLIAEALGASVTKNKYQEIGFHPVSLTPFAKTHSVFNVLPNNLLVFHWHGDTFSLPEGAIHLMESAGCANQAFIARERVIGLQFHLEVSKNSVEEWVKEMPIVPSNEEPYIQKKSQVLSLTSYCDEIQKYLFAVLNNIEGKIWGGSSAQGGHGGPPLQS